MSAKFFLPSLVAAGALLGAATRADEPYSGSDRDPALRAPADDGYAVGEQRRARISARHRGSATLARPSFCCGVRVR